MKSCEEIQELIPAYVLDAVGESERASIEEHLPRCSDCRRLVQDYAPVVDLLPYAAQEFEPRAELKNRILDATTPRKIVELAPAPRFSLSGWLAGLFRSPAFSAVTLLLVLGVVLWNVALQNQIAQQAQELAHQRDLVTVLAYSNGSAHELQGTPAAAQAVGRLYGGYDDATFVVVTYDMPKLPSGKVYQLWLIDAAGNRTSGGTFAVDNDGRGWLFAHAPQGLGQYHSVGVTVEPLGGSPGPTGAKMLGGNL